MRFVPAVVLIVALLFVLPVAVGVRKRRTWLVLPIAALLTAGAVFWAWTTVDRQQEVLDAVVSAQGDQLVVSYTGGECEDHRSVSVDEGDRRVRVSVVTRSFASACSDVGVHYDVAVTLREPLASREVVNVGCTRDRVGCRRVLAPPPLSPGGES